MRGAGCGARGAGRGARSAGCGVRGGGCGVRGRCGGRGVRGAGCGEDVRQFRPARRAGHLSPRTGDRPTDQQPCLQRARNYPTVEA
ncbi:MAG: hypothetical protein DMF84_19330 [Acidobacteria bacterium]|nr:MAG: hypothetical protein DMF84_19330 [Acidobacteriota bacterium]